METILEIYENDSFPLTPQLAAAQSAAEKHQALYNQILLPASGVNSIRSASYADVECLSEASFQELNLSKKPLLFPTQLGIRSSSCADVECLSEANFQELNLSNKLLPFPTQGPLVMRSMSCTPVLIAAVAQQQQQQQQQNIQPSGLKDRDRLDKVARAFAQSSITTEWNKQNLQHQLLQPNNKISSNVNSHIMVESAVTESAFVGAIYNHNNNNNNFNSHKLLTQHQQQDNAAFGEPALPADKQQQQASTTVPSSHHNIPQGSSAFKNRSGGSLPFRNSLHGFKRPQQPNVGQGTASKKTSLALSNIKLGDAVDVQSQQQQPPLQKRRVSFSQSAPEIHYVEGKRHYKRAGKWPEYSNEDKMRVQIEIDQLNSELIRPESLRLTKSEVILRKPVVSTKSQQQQKPSINSNTTHTELLRRVSDGSIDIFKPHHDDDNDTNVVHKHGNTSSLWSKLSPKRLFHRISSHSH